MTFTEYIGHFHPLLVHLPIGILLFAMALMLIGRLKSVDLDAAVSIAWLLGAVSALLACGAGWLLAQSGEYDAKLVQLHQWTGLATAGISTLTVLLKRYRWPLAIATVCLLTVAGHYGGNLTHGEDYLSFTRHTDSASDTTTLAQAEPVALRTDSTTQSNQPTIRRTFFYRDQVVPVLKTNCYSCHSARKKKGGLRLDTEAFIKQGGKNGAVLVAGNPQKSKLFSYLLLPHDDDQHMPPKGKRPLTNQEIAILHHWIKSGASFREEMEVIPAQETPLATVASLPVPELAVPALADTVNAPPYNNEPGVETSILAKPVAAPDAALVNKLKQQQIALGPLREDTPYLTANFVNVKTIRPDMLTDLDGVRQQLVHLRLTNQPVADADIKRFMTYPNLTRLNLENTRITDTALAYLSQLPNLEQLNLYGTSVTDAGLEKLARSPRLKVVYLWQTKTTPTGIDRLHKAKPTLKIEAGNLQLTHPDTNKTL
ncbi:c-type cytochrome domain-containing protein [Spirosoma sp. SC4-14]|uniref:c-type cytochrome domain-containing protein n=1 Tax=Spirosoma sp. SC4-14 TaxID=3128900 RepID=UPI0030CC5B1B